MIQISNIKLPIYHTEEELTRKIQKLLRLSGQHPFTYEILRQSLDARKKEKLFVYSVLVKTEQEQKILHKVGNNNIMSTKKQKYHFPHSGREPLNSRPVIVGSGPAGLFCAYELALHGYCPLILERGDTARKRQEKVERFWESGQLDARSNVQFGEGGAGTFSDGKLNTLVKDPLGRSKEVLRIFTEFGAPEEICYQQKPHLGTDVLIPIVENMRHRIEELGGRFLFQSQMTDLIIQEGSIQGIEINGKETIPVQLLVLAIGHSARDTFEVLLKHQLDMKPKSFAIGLRVEHPQEMMNLALYGEKEIPQLGAAAYKLTAKTSNGRGAYTFCMCPGGYVVNASSEPGRLAVNGMSYQKRNSPNANSAVIVTVTPEDFPSDETLSGVYFQQELERAAYELADGKVPVQLFGDFKENRITDKLGEITPCIKGEWAFANLRRILPKEVAASLEEGMLAFDHKIKGFAREDAVLSGIESRTSSPVRMERKESFESNYGGIYPCGEGAGYAGGITSAAMDGMKVAEAIASRYQPYHA